MSLINDALKKAQREQHENSAGVVPPLPGGGRIRKRGNAMPAQTVVLIVVGAVVFAVVSAVGAVLYFNREPAAKPPVATNVSAPAAGIETFAATIPKIEINVAPPPSTPPLSLAPATPEPVTTAPLKVAPSERSSEAPPATTTRQTSLAETTPTPPPPKGPPVPDDRVHAFLDTVRLTGVRASGKDSRVRMNEVVHRLNDVVDRTLGLKLTGVASDHLTFTDANGIEYVKNF